MTRIEHCLENSTVPVEYELYKKYILNNKNNEHNMCVFKHCEILTKCMVVHRLQFTGQF